MTRALLTIGAIIRSVVGVLAADDGDWGITTVCLASAILVGVSCLAIKAAA